MTARPNQYDVPRNVTPQSEEDRWRENQGTVHPGEEHRMSGDLPVQWDTPKASEANESPAVNLQYGAFDGALVGPTPAGFANLRTGRGQ